tara:strand:- start:43760 stop:44338 length:579 start_codon:yes stop_codon:yes gene_type:complete
LGAIVKEENQEQHTLMTKSEYARHRGVTPAAVNDAIKQGKITEAIFKVKGRDRVAAEIADQLWLKRTSVNNKNSATLFANVDPAQAENKKTSSTYTKSRAAKEAFAAKMAQLKYEKEAGKLVNAMSVKKAANSIGRVTRDRLMSIPERLAPMLSAEEDIDEIREILIRELHDALESLSKMDLAKELEEASND